MKTYYTFSPIRTHSRLRLLTKYLVLIVMMLSGSISLGLAATVEGEIENRPSAVARRMCLGGVNAGEACNENTNCPGSTCRDRNIFNLSVSVEYDAPDADIDEIKDLISAASVSIFDATDGQVEIGSATIHNNATGIGEADLRVYPATCTSGTNTGMACNVNNDCPPNTGDVRGACGIWWQALAGAYHKGGSMYVSINNIRGTADPGPVLAHEFTHLVFDARDEYESRAVGCLDVIGGATCPHQDAIDAGQEVSMMDGNGTEYCWGQGDPSNTTDMTGGNHDAHNITEQSRCRDNRSIWDQVIWSWPKTIKKPAAAPDPGSGGAVVNATHFTVSHDTVRVVLVLDESGSMDLESPKRIERLRVAAKDFVLLAETGTELGIVSYSDDAEEASGRALVPIDSLGADRSDWTDAIDGLTPDNRTNIGDGLRKAKAMIIDAGGVTANTYVVLMSDGRNNEPQPQSTADADLQSAVNDLLLAGIPVYVTCTGSDLGLQSQCSEIATGTNGFYVDSADAASLPEAFVDFHERLTGREGIDSVMGQLAKPEGASPKEFYIDAGSNSATFVAQWTTPDSKASVSIYDPDGTLYQTIGIPQGRYLRVADPKPGIWKAVLDPSGGSRGEFILRAYTRHQINNMLAAVRYPRVRPGEDIYVYAYPKSYGGLMTSPDGKIIARVTLPDGSTDTLELLDKGRDATGQGDDMAGDAIFTGVYKNTSSKGAYQFLIRAQIDNWVVGSNAHDAGIYPVPSPKFDREIRLSATVGDPEDVVAVPEDDKPDGPITPDPSECDSQGTFLLWLILTLLLLAIFMIWWCSCRKRILG